jgi:hypothetical protein
MKRNLSFVAATLLILQSAAGQQSLSVERIVAELAPGNHPSQGFVRDYAFLLEQRLGQLEDFAAFLASKRPSLCNLLCEKNVTAGYFRSEVLGPGELVQYALTATCYGVMQGSRHRGQALDDLETILGKQNWYVQEQSLSDIDKLNIRTSIGDLIT